MKTYSFEWNVPLDLIVRANNTTEAKDKLIEAFRERFPAVDCEVLANLVSVQEDPYMSYIHL